MKKHRWLDAQESEDERERREARITIPKPAPGDRNNPDSDRRIAEIGKIARELANPSGLTFHQKIAACAGAPDSGAEDEMSKALDAIESTLRELAEGPVGVPAKRPRPARQTSAGRPTLIRPSVSTRPAPRPPAASISTPAGTPKIAGPSDLSHLDGWNHSAALHYYAFRDRLAGDIRSGKLRPDPGSLIDHAATYGLKRDDAAEWTERFFASIGRDLERRRAAYYHGAIR